MEIFFEESTSITDKFREKSLESVNNKDDKRNTKDKSVELDYKKDECDSSIIITRSGPISRKPDRFKY